VDSGPKASDLVKGPLTGLATLVTAPFGKTVGKTRNSYGGVSARRKREEFSDYFLKKYEELESLIEEAGDNIIALDHGVPYGSGMDDVGRGEETNYQGSLVERPA